MQRATTAIGTFVLMAAALVLSHPYGGIRHDGILYLGEALVDLDPARMADDLFFVFGSQASFSIVPGLYAKAIDCLGIGNASRTLLAASLTLYFLAVGWVARRLIGAGLRSWAILTVFVAAPVYGGHRVFAYGETFFTARSLAEPLVLVGVGFVLRGRPLAALLCMAASALVHPLIGLPGILVVWCWLVLDDRRWSWAALLGVLPVGLALAAISPFDGLFKRYDPAWIAVVREANPFVFILNWGLSDWSLIALDVVVLGWAIRSSKDPRAVLPRFAQAALLAGLLGIAGAFVGGDLLSNVLLTGLQLWRAHWLMHWTAMALLPWLVHMLWTRDTANDRAAALLVLASVFSITTFGPLVMAPAAVALVVFRRSAPVSKAIVYASGLLVLGLAVVLATRQVTTLGSLAKGVDEPLFVRAATCLSISLVLLSVASLILRHIRKWPFAGAVASATLLVVALLGWDQRDPWIRYQENYSGLHGLLWAETVAPSDRVYWFHEVLAPWLTMHHANYYSANQASGALFNRKTSLELARRRALTAPLDLQETICRMMNGLNEKETSCEPDIGAVRDLCASADQLSFVVLQSVLPVRAAGEFRTGFVEHNFEKTFYLYRCVDVASH